MVHQKDVPERKQTALGLYVTSAEAYEMWKADPDGVHVVDVRTPEEYIFVGHAPMARNVPLLFIKYQWDAEKDEPAITPSSDFGTTMKSLFSADDTLLMMCRSGGRSAISVNALVQAGFTKVYNVIDGFEGDVVAEDGSLYIGKRLKNGWKNSGSPWTYECDTDLLWIVEDEQ
jgi:rhodanese-related sulfurtransferase